MKIDQLYAAECIHSSSPQ